MVSPWKTIIITQVNSHFATETYLVVSSECRRADFENANHLCVARHNFKKKLIFNKI